MNLEFFVAGRKLTRKGGCAPVADGTGVDTFTIEFDREWDGLVKLVELKNGAASARVLYTGKTPLPRQVCGRGELYLTCCGYRQKDDTVAVVRTVPMVRPVRLTGADPVTGSSDQPYTPPVFDQMAAKVAQAESAAQQAQQTAAELLALKEAGAFTGPAGPAATVRVDETVRYGKPAAVENLGTAGHALLRFTLPYGLSGEERQTMAAQIKEEALGDIDAALDEILSIQEILLQTYPAEDSEEAAQ